MKMKAILEIDRVFHFHPTEGDDVEVHFSTLAANNDSGPSDAAIEKMIEKSDHDFTTNCAIEINIHNSADHSTDKWGNLRINKYYQEAYASLKYQKPFLSLLFAWCFNM